MAGLDESRRSDFIAMLQEVGGSKDRDELVQHLDPVALCTETIRTVQMVSESLLLRERDMPLSKQPFSGCCDTLVARSKQTSSVLTSIETLVTSGQFMELCEPLSSLAENVAIITEAVAQAVYMVAEKNPDCKRAEPGIIDNYPLSRGRLALELAVHAFEKPGISPKQVMAVSAVIATHLESLREQCKMAAELHDDELVKAQFMASARGLSGTTSMVVAAVKAYIEMPTEMSRISLNLFSAPLISTIDSLLAYVHSHEDFFGKPPRMSREVADYVKPIQGAALSVVSATTLFLGSVKTILTDPTDANASVRLRGFGVAIDDGLDVLVKACKTVRSADIVYDPKNE